jgi:hypothetical protein
MSQVRNLSGEGFNPNHINMNDDMIGIIWFGQLVLQIVNTAQLVVLLERK